VRAGQLRALGVSSPQRISAAPELPMIAEQGVPGFEAEQWYCLVAPAGMLRKIIDRLNAASTRILREPTLRTRLDTEGVEAAPGTPEEFGALIGRERERWGALIRRAGICAN
jgi:tripartite-type tricarboxylate transporter receptor subunit TctC